MSDIQEKKKGHCPVQISFDLIDAPKDIQMLYIIEACINHFKEHLDVDMFTCENVVGYLSAKYGRDE